MPKLRASASDAVQEQQKQRVLVATNTTDANSPVQSVETETSFDIDALARAVARHETASCTKGYGAEYNNCFGIKNGSIAPCERIGRNRMCIYEKPEDSYEAFKKIWVVGYGGGLPTLKMAQVYSGNDRATIWKNNVLKFYYEEL